MEIEQTLPKEIEEKCRLFSEQVKEIEGQLETIIARYKLLILYIYYILF